LVDDQYFDKQKRVEFQNSWWLMSWISVFLERPITIRGGCSVARRLFRQLDKNIPLFGKFALLVHRSQNVSYIYATFGILFILNNVNKGTN
jgi:hypothetical protein